MQINEQTNDLDMHISTIFCKTSIYDNSIFEGISKCIQRILPRRNSVQNILNSLSQSCNMDKVYLFDTYTKLCIAMDSTPGDVGMYELCGDSIDVIFELVDIYCKSEQAPQYVGTFGDFIEQEKCKAGSLPIISSITYN